MGIDFLNFNAMKNISQLTRLQKAHRLIQLGNTGTPKEFAAKLNVSERFLYKMLAELRAYDAPLLFDKSAATYYYHSEFDLQVNISVKVLAKGEVTCIY